MLTRTGSRGHGSPHCGQQNPQQCDTEISDSVTVRMRANAPGDSRPGLLVFRPELLNAFLEHGFAIRVGSQWCNK
jgi:hypothetical protein